MAVDNERNVDEQPNNPLHGITLEMALTRLVAYYGWEKTENEIGRK